MVDKDIIPEGAQCSQWGRSMAQAFPEHIVRKMVEDGVLSEGCLPTEEPQTVEELEERIEELERHLEELQQEKAAEEVAEGEAA